MIRRLLVRASHRRAIRTVNHDARFNRAYRLLLAAHYAAVAADHNRHGRYTQAYEAFVLSDAASQGEL